MLMAVRAVVSQGISAFTATVPLVLLRLLLPDMTMLALELRATLPVSVVPARDKLVLPVCVTLTMALPPAVLVILEPLAKTNALPPPHD